MVSAVNVYYKTSTLKGNHTSGGSYPISFSILEYIYIYIPYIPSHVLFSYILYGL